MSNHLGVEIEAEVKAFDLLREVAVSGYSELPKFGILVKVGGDNAHRA